MNAVEFENVVKGFGSTTAIDHISLKIPTGGAIGVVGPNGAGKSTFFSLIAGFIRPNSGDIRIFGLPAGDPQLKQRVSILPQDAHFQKHVSLRRQLQLLAQLQGSPAHQAAGIAEEVLKFLGIAEKGDVKPSALSFGMYKRALLAQTLFGQPQLVLLDEPTAGIDSANAQAIHAVIRVKSRKSTFLISSHNLRDIENLCDAIIILKSGRVVHQSNLEDLVERESTLTVGLPQALPADVMARLRDLDDVKEITTSGEGDYRIVIRFNDQAQRPIEIDVLQELFRAGIGYRDMCRGTSLADRVREMTGKSTLPGTSPSSS